MTSKCCSFYQRTSLDTRDNFYLLTIDTLDKFQRFNNSIQENHYHDCHIIEIVFDKHTHLMTDKVVRFLQRCPNLYRISIKDTRDSPSDTFEKVPTFLRACHSSLRQIVLNFKHSAFNFIDTILPADHPIPCLAKVEMLEWVTYYPIADDHLPMLKLLDNMPKLKDLDMVFMKYDNSKSVLTDEALEQITQHYPQLRNISFRYSNLSDDKIVMFIRSRNETTTMLDFKGSNISDELLDKLADLCPKLESLYLIKAKGFSRIGVRRVVLKCKNLSTLIFANEKERIEGDGWRKYEERMKKANITNPWRVVGREAIEKAYHCMNS